MRPDLKKEGTEVEIRGMMLEEESLLCHVHPSLWTNISIRHIVRCTLGGKNTRKYLHASDYSAVTAKNVIFAPLLTIKHSHFMPI